MSKIKFLADTTENLIVNPSTEKTSATSTYQPTATHPNPANTPSISFIPSSNFKSMNPSSAPFQNIKTTSKPQRFNNFTGNNFTSLSPTISPTHVMNTHGPIMITTLQPIVIFNVTSTPTSNNESSSQGRYDSKPYTIASIVVFTFFILFIVAVICYASLGQTEPPLQRTLSPPKSKHSASTNQENEKKELLEPLPTTSSTWKSFPQNDDEHSKV